MNAPPTSRARPFNKLAAIAVALLATAASLVFLLWPASSDAVKGGTTGAAKVAGESNARANGGPPAGDAARVENILTGNETKDGLELTEARKATLLKYYRDAADRSKKLEAELDRQVAKDQAKMKRSQDALMSAIVLQLPAYISATNNDPQIAFLMRYLLEEPKRVNDVRNALTEASKETAFQGLAASAKNSEELLKLATQLIPEAEAKYRKVADNVERGPELAPLVNGMVLGKLTMTIIREYMKVAGYAFDEIQQVFVPNPAPAAK